MARARGFFMQQFPCPECKRMISANVPTGSLVQCPLCQQTVAVPGGAAAIASPENAAGVRPLSYGSPEAPPSQGMATTSLVTGLIGLVICGPLALVGLITGIIALVRTGREPNRYGGRGMAIAGIVVSGAAMVIYPMLIAILLPSLSRARELSKRTVCAANMRGIGQAMYIYAQSEPNYAFPDDINKVVAAGFTTPIQFQCPSAPPGRQCYFYVSGQTTNSAPNSVVLFEDPNNHQGEGGNVMYQDGHVTFVKGAQYQAIVDQHIDSAE
jgi:prepilin-type processing-associated H-X9-DG protein